MRLLHALCNRTLHGWGLAALLAGSVQVAHAGYTSVVPPSPIQGGPGAYTAQRTAEVAIEKARNSANAYAKGVGSIPGMPGAKIPFISRVSASAVAKAAARVFFGPELLTASIIASLAAECISYTNDQWHLTCGPDLNINNYPTSDGYKYTTYAFGYSTFFNTPYEACFAHMYKSYAITSDRSVRVYNITNSSCNADIYVTSTGQNTLSGANIPLSRAANPVCPSGWYVTPAGCVQTPPPLPLDEEQFIDKVSPLIPPDKIPDWAPGMPIPIENPKVLPDNDADEDSATPRPLYIPDGEPQPIPNTDPQQYKQPLRRIVPAPTVEDPWRIDIQPVERTSTSPESVSEPTQNPNQTSSGTTAQSDNFDLCKEHPDILACQKPELDVPDGQIPRDSVQITYATESFLGGGGSCPGPTDIHYFGHTARVFETSTACGWISTYMRPILLALCAWLSLSIVMGGLGAIKE